jgi:TolB protein
MLALPLLFLLFFCCSAPLEAMVQPIEVELDTEVNLEPIYIASWQQKDSAYDAGYLRSLQRILQMDFAHNGITDPIEETKERNEFAYKNSKEVLETWEKLHIAYLIRGSVAGSSLSVEILDLASKKVKGAPQIALTGSLNADRKKIHELADQLLKELFGREGVASTSILYTVRINGGGKWLSDIWECDYDGANAHPVVQNEGYSVMPTYLPPAEGCKASNICYVSYRTGQPKIYLSAIQEAKSTPLVTLRGNQLMPCMNRQRSQVAFISDVTGNPDLFLLDFDPKKGVLGKPRQLFCARPATQGSPCFSPDGKKIAFVSDKDGSPRIYVIDSGIKQQAKQNPATLITKLNRECTSPAWSPNGIYIAYSAMAQGVRQIWLYDVVSGSEKQLTFGPGHKENPSWAPDSLHLAYNMLSQDASDIYTLNIVQLQPRKLSLSGIEKRFPAWEVR